MSYASSAIKRLSNEYRQIQKQENRVSDYYVAPLEENIFEWHFTLRGPAGDDNDSPYKDGLYHGVLLFSRSYPLEPPDIMFFTRSGRFATNEKICSTISSYHKELWQPTYDVALTLIALRHFMAQEDEFGVGAFPKNMVSVEAKLAWAKETWSFKCSVCGRSTKEDWETEMQPYPETSAEKEALVPKLPSAAAAAAAAAAATASATTSSPAGAAGKTAKGEDEGHEKKEDNVEPARAAAAAPVTPTPSSSTPIGAPDMEAAAATAATDSSDGMKQEVRSSTDEEKGAKDTSLPASAGRTSSRHHIAARSSAEDVAPAASEPKSTPAPSPPSASSGREPPATSARPSNDLFFPEEEEDRTDLPNYATTHVWNGLDGDYYYYHGDFHLDYDGDDWGGDWDENSIPRHRYPTSTPILDDEEARQLEMTGTSSGIPNVRFEPVLRAAIRREARELAAAAEATEAPPPAPPQQPLLRPDVTELPAAGVLPDLTVPPHPAAPVEPPPQQHAANIVFGIHSYRIAIPLLYVDRTIIWSFSLIVLILLRRAVWAMLSAFWSVP